MLGLEFWKLHFFFVREPVMLEEEEGTCTFLYFLNVPYFCEHHITLASPFFFLNPNSLSSFL